MSFCPTVPARLVGEGQNGPSNYHIVGVEQAASNLSEAISQALALSAVSPTDVKAACAGMAGLDGASDQKQMHQILTTALNASGLNCPWRSLNDSVVAWAGAFHGEPGALIASGSGAVAFAVGRERPLSPRRRPRSLAGRRRQRLRYRTPRPARCTGRARRTRACDPSYGAFPRQRRQLTVRMDRLGRRARFQYLPRTRTVPFLRSLCF